MAIFANEVLPPFDRKLPKKWLKKAWAIGLIAYESCTYAYLCPWLTTASLQTLC